MAQSKIQKSISDIQQMYVDTVLSAGSDHVTVAATIPDGYNFLTWTTVSVFGAVLTFDLIWEANNVATIYFSPAPSVNATISVRYLVYK